MLSHLIFIHGALGSASQLSELSNEFTNEFRVHNFELPGHGSSSGSEDFSINEFSAAILRYMDLNSIDRASFFGYSLGGYIALSMAVSHPGRITSVVTYGTKLDWNRIVAEKETRLLDPEIVEVKVPAFAKQLSEKHTALNWKTVMKSTASLMWQLGSSENNTINYENILVPVLLIIGDRDKMVSPEETISAFRRINSSFLAVLPGQPHAIEKADIQMLSDFTRRFLQQRLV